MTGAYEICARPELASNLALSCASSVHDGSQSPISAMKLPLPATTFPILELSHKDAGVLEGVAHHLVQEGMAQFHEHAVLRQGVVDPKIWKKVRSREQVTVYKEHNVAAVMDESGNVSVMPMLLATGTVQGSLDDVMYGVLSHSTDSMRIRSAYMEDGLADAMLLASIVKPTEADPLRSLSLKWAMKDHPAIRATKIKPRDVVYLEATGIAMTNHGDRIGYELMHSVQLPSIRELEDMGIVRANISFCYMYQQISESEVAVFMKGILNVFGSIPASTTTNAAADSLVSIVRSAHCAKMKKLMWLMRTVEPTDKSQRLPSACCVCKQSLVASITKQCCACQERTCARCYAKHKLNFIQPHKPNVATQAKLVFCTRCERRATDTSTMEVAAQDVQDGPAVVVRMADHSHELSLSSRGTSTTSSIKK